MAPLQVEAEVKKSVHKLIYVPQKTPINPNMKLMKSLGVEGRSGGMPAGVCACVCVWRRKEVALGTCHDKEGIDQGEPNDDKCHRLKQQQQRDSVPSGSVRSRPS